MSEPQPLRPWDPQSIGRYHLSGLLGEGGQGSVYLAALDGARVAVKLLHPRYAAHDSARGRFMREIQAARLVSDYTAQVLDAGEHQGVPYVVSEYIPGPSLADRVAADGPCAGGELTRLASGTLAALAAIHAAGIVHCDLKPENILLGPDGPRVVDFGIARALETIAPNASRQIGTPAYMAPEQIDAGLIGPHTDMFAWGATLAFAATGTHTFGAATVPATMHRVLNHDPDLSALPAPLRDLVGTALAKAAGRRPAAIDALVRLLGHPVRARTLVNDTRSDAPPARSRPADPPARTPERRPPPYAVHARKALEGHTNMVTSVRFGELDGRPIALSGSLDHTVRIWDLASMRPIGRPFTGHVKGITSVDFGQVDGRPFAISTSEEAIRLWDLGRMKSVRRPLTGHAGWVASAAFGEFDGHPIALSGGYDKTVRIWDMTAMRPLDRPLTGHDGGVLSVRSGTIHGRPIALSGSVDRTVRVWDLSGMRQLGRPLTGHGERVTSVALGEVDGRPVALSGSEDRSVRVWDLAHMDSEGRLLTRHSGAVTSVAFGRVDGRPVALSGSNDRTVQVWDLTDMRPLTEPFTGHTSVVTSVAFAEAGGRPLLLSGGNDNTLRVCDLKKSV